MTYDPDDAQTDASSSVKKYVGHSCSSQSTTNRIRAPRKAGDAVGGGVGGSSRATWAPVCIWANEGLVKVNFHTNCIN